MVYLTLPCVKKIEILHESVLGVSPVLQVVPQGLFAGAALGNGHTATGVRVIHLFLLLGMGYGGALKTCFRRTRPVPPLLPCAAPSLLSRTSKESPPNPLQSNDIGRTEQREPQAP